MRREPRLIEHRPVTADERAAVERLLADLDARLDAAETIRDWTTVAALGAEAEQLAERIQVGRGCRRWSLDGSGGCEACTERIALAMEAQLWSYRARFGDGPPPRLAPLALTTSATTSNRRTGPACRRRRSVD